MSYATPHLTVHDFLDTLNHQAYTARQVDSKYEMASYGFITFLLVMHSTTVLHPNASLGCFPQVQIGPSEGANRFPDFGSLLCSCTKGVTSKPEGVLRTWWEVKQYSESQRHPSTDVKIREDFASVFEVNMHQFREQAEAAFRAFPDAKRFRMIVSQGLRFALLEWCKPDNKRTPASPFWPWVKGQEESIYKQLQTEKEDLLNNPTFLAAQQYRRAQSLLTDRTAYVPSPDRDSRASFERQKGKIAKVMRDCESALHPRNLVRIVYFAEPMFTLSTQEENDWQRITELTPQFRHALRAMCDRTNTESPRFSYTPSFFDPPASLLATDIAPVMGVQAGIDVIVKEEFERFRTRCQTLRKNRNFTLLTRHRLNSSTSVESPSDSNVTSADVSNWLPESDEGPSSSPPDSPIATHRARRTNRTQPNYVESSEETAKSTSNSE